MHNGDCFALSDTLKTWLVYSPDIKDKGRLYRCEEYQCSFQLSLLDCWQHQMEDLLERSAILGREASSRERDQGVETEELYPFRVNTRRRENCWEFEREKQL